MKLTPMPFADAERLIAIGRAHRPLPDLSDHANIIPFPVERVTYRAPSPNNMKDRL